MLIVRLLIELSLCGMSSYSILLGRDAMRDCFARSAPGFAALPLPCLHSTTRCSALPCPALPCSALPCPALLCPAVLALVLPCLSSPVHIADLVYLRPPSICHSPPLCAGRTSLSIKPPTPTPAPSCALACGAGQMPTYLSGGWPALDGCCRRTGDLAT